MVRARVLYCEMGLFLFLRLCGRPIPVYDPLSTILFTLQVPCMTPLVYDLFYDLYNPASVYYTLYVRLHPSVL